MKGGNYRQLVFVDTSLNHVKAELEHIKLVISMEPNPIALHIAAQAYPIGLSRIHHGSA